MDAAAAPARSLVYDRAAFGIARSQRARITMRSAYFSIDVTMERVPLASRWADERWLPSAVVPLAEGRATAGEPVREADGPQGTRWRFPRMEVELHPTEAEGYYLNLTSEAPVAFVMWRFADDGTEPAALPDKVTLSYNEAGRSMDGGARVDPVPLAETLRAWLAAFVAVHYQPEPRRKVKRNDPFKDGAFVRDRGRRG